MPMAMAPTTGSGANDAPSGSGGAVPKIDQHSSSRNRVLRSLARTSLMQASSTQPLRQPPTTSDSVGKRLPPPLQHAVRQLSQQRLAVIEAVQSRAQRALYAGRTVETVLVFG